MPGCLGPVDTNGASFGAEAVDAVFGVSYQRPFRDFCLSEQAAPAGKKGRDDVDGRRAVFFAARPVHSLTLCRDDMATQQQCTCCRYSAACA